MATRRHIQSPPPPLPMNNIPQQKRLSDMNKTKKKYIAPDIEVIEMEESHFLTGSFNQQKVIGGQAAYENWDNIPEGDKDIMTGDKKLEIDNGGGDYNLWDDM